MSHNCVPELTGWREGKTWSCWRTRGWISGEGRECVEGENICLLVAADGSARKWSEDEICTLRFCTVRAHISEGFWKLATQILECLLSLPSNNSISLHCNIRYSSRKKILNLFTLYSILHIMFLNISEAFTWTHTFLSTSSEEESMSGIIIKRKKQMCCIKNILIHMTDGCVPSAVPSSSA